MAEWTHRICERCWFDGTSDLDPPAWMADGTFRMPMQVKEAEPGACCSCGGLTITGIWFRRDENQLRCQGRHEPEQLGSWSRVQLG